MWMRLQTEQLPKWPRWCQPNQRRRRGGDMNREAREALLTGRHAEVISADVHQVDAALTGL